LTKLGWATFWAIFFTKPSDQWPPFWLRNIKINGMSEVTVERLRVLFKIVPSKNSRLFYGDYSDVFKVCT
jgi:hypothetical protein